MEGNKEFTASGDRLPAFEINFIGEVHDQGIVCNLNFKLELKLNKG